MIDLGRRPVARMKSLVDARDPSAKGVEYFGFGLAIYLDESEEPSMIVEREKGGISCVDVKLMVFTDRWFIGDPRLMRSN